MNDPQQPVPQNEVQQKNRRTRKPASNTPKRLFSFEEAAWYLGVSRWTVDKMVERGKLPVVLIGEKRKLIAIEDLEALVLKNKEGGNAGS